MQQIFRDIDGVLWCNVDDSELFKSEDGQGTVWQFVTADFSWVKDSNGRVHVVYPKKDEDYSTSYRRSDMCPRSAGP